MIDAPVLVGDEISTRKDDVTRDPRPQRQCHVPFVTINWTLMTSYHSSAADCVTH
jgi:hypothetical protein